MFGFKNQKQESYNPVKSEDTENLLASSETSSLDGHPTRIPVRRQSWIATSIMIFCTAVLSALFGAWAGRQGFNADDFSIRHISEYSPIIKEVDMTFERVRFNGSFLKLNAFRQDAGPEVDAAWKSLGADFHAVRIPASEAAASNIRHDQVKIKEKYGGGFPANVEGLHHLHCLNLLRKSLAWNIDYYKAMKMGPFSNEEYVLKAHVTHCLDILRQQLMCNVDVGVLGQIWWQPPDSGVEAFVDFNTVHTCRNFDLVRDWAEKHQLPGDVPDDYLESPKEGDMVYPEIP